MPWGQTVVASTTESRAPVLSLREVMALEEAEAAKQIEDAADTLLQAALAQSKKEAEENKVLPTEKACVVCTFMNKPEVSHCEMCSSQLPEIPATEASEVCTSTPTMNEPVELVSTSTEPLPAVEVVHVTAESSSELNTSATEGSSIDTDFALALSLSETNVSVEADNITVTSSDVVPSSSNDFGSLDLALALHMQQEEERKSSAWNVGEGEDLAKQRDPMWQARHKTADNLGILFGFEERKIIGADDEMESMDHYEEEESSQSQRTLNASKSPYKPKLLVEGECIDPRDYGVSWVKMGDGSIVTKHDTKLNGQRNLINAMNRLPHMGDLENGSNNGSKSGGGASIGFSNTTYNAMARSVKKASNGNIKKGINQRGRVEGENRATRVGVLDTSTRKTILSLINIGILEEMHGVVKTGKEAAVFYSKGRERPIDYNNDDDDDRTIDDLEEEKEEAEEEEEEEEEEGTAATDEAAFLDFEKEAIFSNRQELDIVKESDAASEVGSSNSSLRATSTPNKKHSKYGNNPNIFIGGEDLGALSSEVVPVAVKIFFTSLDQFSNRVDYMKGDPRYSDRNLSRLSTRKMLTTWCDKEFRNLCRVARVGIPCPKPIFHRKQVLIMRFIEEESGCTNPAPQLHEFPSKALSSSQWHRCYLLTCGIVRTLWQQSKLVHGDLSEYNLLYKDKTVYVIDFGQAVDVHHPEAIKLLTRDLSNVIAFFGKRRSVNIHSMKTLITFVTDNNLKCPPISSQSIGQEDVEGEKRAFGCYPGDEEELSEILDQVGSEEDRIEEAMKQALLKDCGREPNSLSTAQLFSDMQTQGV